MQTQLATTLQQLATLQRPKNAGSLRPPLLLPTITVARPDLWAFNLHRVRDVDKVISGGFVAKLVQVFELPVEYTERNVCE